MSNETKVLTVCAIDPGKTTGVCTAQVLIRNNSVHRLEIAKSIEIPWDQRFYGLESILTGHWWNHIVCEDFRLYKTHSKDQINSRFPSSQLIGVVEYLAWKEGSPVHFQMAAARLRTNVLVDHIDTVGGVTRNGRPKSQHRWDAYQHLRYFVTINAKKLQEESSKICL